MNRSLGSGLIVAGTAIGAGMLAMPIALAEAGLWGSFAILILVWAFSCLGALLLTEIYQHVSPDTGLGTLAGMYFGWLGKSVCALCMMLLMYALVGAYISGASEIIVALFAALDIHVPGALASLGVALVGGGIVYIGTSSVDSVNRLLFVSMLVFLLLVLVSLGGHAHWHHVRSSAMGNKLMVLTAIPVIFTSFGFHGSVPSIVKYMRVEARHLRLIFILGSAVPLLAYLCWQWVTIASMGSGVFVSILAAHGGLGDILASIDAIVSNHWVILFARLFMSLALATSFLGVALGLFDFMADFLRRKNHAGGRMQTALITFVPPLMFALFYPQGFIAALGYAAAFLSVIALVLPAMIAYKSRKLHQNQAYKLMGGNLMLGLVWLFGVLIIVLQLGIALHGLPNGG